MTDRKPFETFAHYKIGKGLATLSVSVDDGKARVGISYCHPRDGFDKSKGRTIARARRDSGSTFGFEFVRNKQKLVEQLRSEFEGFVAESGTALMALKDADAIAPRLGAPRWAIYSLGRELRRRERSAIENHISASCCC